MRFGEFIHEFQDQGGRYAFGVPGGGESLVLMDALEKAGGRFIATGHETTGALMAGGLSRLTGHPAMALSIKGPGFANLFPGLLSNSYEGYPQLSLSEAYPSGIRRSHKRLDHGGVSRGVIRAQSEFDESSGFFSRCWREAKKEFPGPVHVDLVSAKGPSEPSGEVAPVGDRGSLAMVNERLRRRERPAVIVGSLALRSSWRKALESLRVPVFTTVAAKGAIPEAGRHAAGVYTGEGKALSPERTVLPKADAVLAIGVRSGEVLGVNPPHSETIAIESAELGPRSVFPPDLFEARVSLTAVEIEEVLLSLHDRNWGESEVSAAHQALTRAAEEWSWSPAQAFRAVQSALPGAIHVVDTGNFTVLAEHLLRVDSDADLLGTPNGRFMGAGVGYALGACLHSDRRPVVLWIGDGGVRAFVGELALAVDHRWPLLVAIMKDGYFGSIRGRAIEKGLSTAGLTLSDRPTVATAEGMGMPAGRVDSESALSSYLATWRSGEGPALVECRFDPDAYRATAELLR